MDMTNGTSALSLDTDIILTKEDKQFLSAIQDKDTRRQVIAILLGE